MKKIFPDQIVFFWRKGKGMRSLSQIIVKVGPRPTRTGFRWIRTQLSLPFMFPYFNHLFALRLPAITHELVSTLYPTMVDITTRSLLSSLDPNTRAHLYNVERHPALHTLHVTPHLPCTVIPHTIDFPTFPAPRAQHLASTCYAWLCERAQGGLLGFFGYKLVCDVVFVFFVTKWQNKWGRMIEW